MPKINYNQKQTKLIEGLELKMAELLLDNYKKEASLLNCMVEWLHRGEPVTAILEAEAAGMDEKVLTVMREIFNVAKF
jgi:hypothetical protein